MIGVFAVDPGLHTGVALGTFCDDVGLTVSERVAEALARDALRSFEVVLDEKDGRAAELSAAVVIAREWEQFMFDCCVIADLPRGAVAASCRLVMEDWILRPGQMKSSERAALYPVRIASAVEGLLYGRLNGAHEGVAGSDRAGVGRGLSGDHRIRVPVYQTPSQAKRFATDARLRRYGLWRRGSDHERDAYRHLCTFLASLP